MTSTVLARPSAGSRRPRPRHYLMCPPTFFDVTYAINPWMDPSVPVDSGRALAQWSALVQTYRAYGHRVDLLPAQEGLVDMVFAANGAIVVDGHVLPARFASTQRSAEAAVHTAWHRENGDLYAARGLAVPTAVNEAEGDFAVLRDRVLAGHGFRTSPDAHAELAAVTGREVLSLELVDSRFYHHDVALTVLDDETDHIAYYPPAFSESSRRLLATRFPDAVLADTDDALAFGLNCVSDGRHVFVPAAAQAFADTLATAGYEPVLVDLSELLLGGGSVKCCTQEIRPPATRTHHRPGDAS